MYVSVILVRVLRHRFRRDDKCIYPISFEDFTSVRKDVGVRRNRRHARLLVNHPRADDPTDGVVRRYPRSCNRRVNYRLSILPGKLPGKPLKCVRSSGKTRRVLVEVVASRTRVNRFEIFTGVIDTYVCVSQSGSATIEESVTAKSFRVSLWRELNWCI